MIVVVHQKLGAATFQKDFWNGGETYFDRSKGFYKALGYVNFLDRFRTTFPFHQHVGSNETMTDTQLLIPSFFFKSGGKLRWASIDQLLRPSLWFNAIRNLRSGVRGNLLVGEGRIFGGLYIVRQGDQGIAYQFEETVLGNLAPISKVLEVCSEISGVNLKEAAIAKAKRQDAQVQERKEAAAAAGQTECEDDVCALPPSKL